MVSRCEACVTPWTSLGAFMCPICGTRVRLVDAIAVRDPSIPEEPAPPKLEAAQAGAADRSPLRSAA
jgi:uncharacterized Zn finger protein (UPF0148 family)